MFAIWLIHGHSLVANFILVTNFIDCSMQDVVRFVCVLVYFIIYFYVYYRVSILGIPKKKVSVHTDFRGWLEMY